MESHVLAHQGDLHAADGITRHHVGRRDIDVLLLAAAEAEDAGMLQKAADDARDGDVVRIARYAGG